MTRPLHLIQSLSPRPCKVKPEWPTPASLTLAEVHNLSFKATLTVAEALSLALYVARSQGVEGAMAAFTSTARVLLNYAGRKGIEDFAELTQAQVHHFIFNETAGMGFPTTEEKHLRRNLLMLVHLACNMYVINVPRDAALVTDLQPRTGGLRRPMMDDEITLARLASRYKPFQGSTAKRTGRDTRTLRAAMWGIVESGAGSGELAQLTVRSLTSHGLAMNVTLSGTRDATARTVELTPWATRHCNALLSQLNPDPLRCPGLFYNGQAHPGSASAQGSTSGVLGEIFEVAGLKQIGLKALQAPMWRARSIFDETKKLADASHILGCRAVKAITVLGIDSDHLGGMGESS